MFNVDPKTKTLTNQPETGAIYSPSLSRVVGRWGVVVEAERVENRPVFVFGHVGDGRAKSAVMEVRRQR